MMAPIGHWLLAAAWRVVSVPIRVKIVGIVGVMIGILGSAAFFQVEKIVKPLLYHDLLKQAQSLAHSLAAALEAPVLAGDVFFIEQQLEKAISAFPDIRFVVVRDSLGRVMADASGKRELDFRPALPTSISEEPRTRLLQTGDGLIAEAVFPVLDGEGGSIQLGISDAVVAAKLGQFNRSSLLSFGFSLLIGVSLALILTHLFARPIGHLVDVTRRISSGDLTARAMVFSVDEVGRLAVALNEMAERLERSSREVKQKEEVRVALLRRIVDLQEEERKRLSRELHDHLGQSLLSLLLEVQLASSGTDRPGRGHAVIEDRVRQLMGDVHRLAWGMRPSVLDDYGLDSALRAYIEETSRLSGVPIDYHYLDTNGSGRLPPVVELTLYRITQEALTNVVRHAEAARSSVVVLRQAREVVLIVEDDGRGFDPVLAAEKPSGFGLAGISERVAGCQGRCDIESAANRGTTIRVRIPLPGSEHGDTNTTGR